MKKIKSIREDIKCKTSIDISVTNKIFTKM